MSFFKSLKEKPFHRQEWLVSSLIIIFFAFLMWYKIDYFAFWRDEAVSANLTRNSFANIIFARSQDVHPPLHNVLLKIFSTFFGTSELILRLPSYLFSILMLIGVYFLAKFNKFKPYQIYASLLIIGSNIQVLFFAQEARAYSLKMCLMVWIIYLLQKLWQKFSIKISFLVVLLSLILLYSHNLSVLIFAALSLWYIPAALYRIYQEKTSFSDPSNLVQNSTSEENISTNLDKKSIKTQKQISNSTKQNKTWLEATKPILPYFITALIIFIGYLPWLIIIIQQTLRLQNDGFWDDMTIIGEMNKWYNEGMNLEGFEKFWHLYLYPVLATNFYLILGFFSLKFAFKKGSFLIQFFWLQFFVIYLLAIKMDILYDRYTAFTIPIIVLFAIEIINRFEIPIWFKKWLEKLVNSENLEKLNLKKIIVNLKNVILNVKVLEFVKFLIILIWTIYASFIGIFTHLYNINYPYTLKNVQFKPDYFSASSKLTQLQKDFPASSTVHPQALSYHSFKYYNYPNQGFVFDPERTQPHYFGIAALDEKDYFDGNEQDLLLKKEIIVINIFPVPDFKNMLFENGFRVAKCYNFEGGTDMEVWQFNNSFEPVEDENYKYECEKENF
jgi:hypothetical protein